MNHPYFDKYKGFLRTFLKKVWNDGLYQDVRTQEQTLGIFFSENKDRVETLWLNMGILL